MKTKNIKKSATQKYSTKSDTLKNIGKIEYREQKSNFGVLKQEISPDNVIEMAELIAISETKFLIAKMGAFMTKIHNELYHDVMAKHGDCYNFSNAYDLVQTAALFLCQHYGEYLHDIVAYNKRGKAINLERVCQHAIQKEINLWLRDSQRLIAIEELKDDEEPDYEADLFNETQRGFEKVDAVISRMGLNERQSEALECRMSGHSYPEIARQIGRCTSSVFEMFGRFRPKFNAIRADFDI